MTDTDTKPELKRDSQPNPPVRQDKVVETHHTLKIGENTLDYTVTTGGILVLKEEDEKFGEKPKASIFYAAYQLRTETYDRAGLLSEHTWVIPVLFVAGTGRRSP